MTAFVTRFAPSPTGYLHLGHAAAAHHVWKAAKAANSLPLLRIEDIDTSRCRPEFTDAIFEDLAWLGFEWPSPVRVQSHHFDEYAAIVAQLVDRSLAYRCFKTRSDLEHTAPAPLSSSEEQRHLDAGHSFAWRLSLNAARETLGQAWQDLCFQLESPQGLKTIPANPNLHGDIVIARKDSPSAYHLAATYDDALQGMTYIIRGEDLADAPHIQTLLQALMDWPHPIYHHHPLILGSDGKRLSKSNGSVPLAELRRSGMTPKDIWKRLGLE